MHVNLDEHTLPCCKAETPETRAESSLICWTWFHRVSQCRFNTVGVSDAISMGTNGMSYSLQSRDLIADSIETTMGAQWYDANVSLPGCDKNMPGTIIAMGRLNRPAIMIYGGTIKPGYSQMTSDPIDIVSAFQSYGECLSI